MKLIDDVQYEKLNSAAALADELAKMTIRYLNLDSEVAPSSDSLEAQANLVRKEVEGLNHGECMAEVMRLRIEIAHLKQCATEVNLPKGLAPTSLPETASGTSLGSISQLAETFKSPMVVKKELIKIGGNTFTPEDVVSVTILNNNKDEVENLCKQGFLEALIEQPIWITPPPSGLSKNDLDHVEMGHTEGRYSKYGDYHVFMAEATATIEQIDRYVYLKPDVWSVISEPYAHTGVYSAGPIEETWFFNKNWYDILNGTLMTTEEAIKLSINPHELEALGVVDRVLFGTNKFPLHWSKSGAYDYVDVYQHEMAVQKQPEISLAAASVATIIEPTYKTTAFHGKPLYFEGPQKHKEGDTLTLNGEYYTVAYSHKNLVLVNEVKY